MQKLLPKDIAELSRNYSLYVLESRAIPHITDGLKSAARRVIWRARDGKKIKTAALAGNTMSIHPHGAPEGAINTLAGFFTNNIPLFTGFGAFGTLLENTEYGAGRYTYVKTSEFTNDVLMRDIEIIPMMDNYDNTELEPKHFLPLIPIVLLNPQQGTATGYATNILPRSLDDIIKSQIAFLSDKPVKDVLPRFIPTNSNCIGAHVDKNGVKRYEFRGEFKRVNSTVVKITSLPYGTTHTKFKTKLNKLETTTDDIVDVIDNSVDSYDIDIKFKRGVLADMSDEKLIKYLGLSVSCTENLNVIDFNSSSVHGTSYQHIIEDFCEWRLSWYHTRYKRLKSLLNVDIQRYEDIILAIDNNVGDLARRVESKTELKKELKNLGIVSLEYIAELPVYRFTKSEKDKVQTKLDSALILLEEYNNLLKSKLLRKEVFLKELNSVLVKYKKGKYTL